MSTVVNWGEDVRDKVREASHTILCCWSDWDSSAGQDEQSAPHPDAYFDKVRAMYAQLDTVLLGLLDEVFVSQQSADEPGKEKTKCES